jgi:hypothetical protein
MTHFRTPFIRTREPISREGVQSWRRQAFRESCRDILGGRCDDLPAEAFFFGNDMGEIERNRDRVLAFGPVAIGAAPAA